MWVWSKYFYNRFELDFCRLFLIQQSFIWRPSDFTVFYDARIEQCAGIQRQSFGENNLKNKPWIYETERFWAVFTEIKFPNSSIGILELLHWQSKLTRIQIPDPGQCFFYKNLKLKMHLILIWFLLNFRQC